MNLQCDEGQEALQTLLPEQANLRAAWQHALQTRQWQLIANCLESTHYFYQRKGFFREEATLLNNAITAIQATLEQDDVSLTSLLSRLLTVRAWCYLHSAQFEIGMTTIERACKLAQNVKNTGIEAQARLAWAQILSTQHKHDSALTQYEQVIPLAKIAKDQILEADGWIGIGSQILWQSDVNPAQEPLLHALELCQTLQYKPGEVEALILLGDLALRREAFALSVNYDEQALQLSRLLGDAAVEAEVLGSLGVGLTSLGDLVGSQTYHKEALVIFRRLTMPEKEQWILGQLGYTSIRLGDYATAEKYLTDALAIATNLKDTFWQAWVKLRLGDVWHELGKSEKALSLLKEVFQIAEQLQNPRFLAAVLYQWGNVLLGQADWAQAEQKFQQAYELWQGQGQTQNAMLALAGLAYAAYQQEMSTTAAAHAEQLRQTLQESPEMAERADLKLYWMLGMVWRGLADRRADNLWKNARALLQQRSEKIEDIGARQMFLQNVPAHRAILEIS